MDRSACLFADTCRTCPAADSMKRTVASVELLCSARSCARQLASGMRQLAAIKKRYRWADALIVPHIFFWGLKIFELG